MCSSFSHHVTARVDFSKYVRLFMAALCNSGGQIYIFILSFVLSSFFRRLISAVADCMSTILAHMVWL